MLNTSEHVLTNPRVRLASQGGVADWFRFWLKAEQSPEPAEQWTGECNTPLQEGVRVPKRNGDRHRIEQQPLEARTTIARLAVEQLDRIRRCIAVQEIGRLTGAPTPIIDAVLALVQERGRTAHLYV